MSLQYFTRNLLVIYIPILLNLPWFFLGSGFILFGIGLRQILGFQTDHPWIRKTCILFLIVAPILFSIGIAWSTVLVQSLPFYWNRYFHPIIPFLLIPIGLVISTSLQSFFRLIQSKAILKNPRMILITVFSLVPFFILPIKLTQSADLFSNNCEDINQAQVEIGLWIKAHSDPSDQIAVMDAGAIRFFSERSALDMVGLNNHEIIGKGKQAVFDQIHQKRPKYIVIFPDLSPEISQSQKVKPVYQVTDDLYTVCDCEPQKTKVVYTWSDSAPITSKNE